MRLPDPHYPDPSDNEKLIAVSKRALINTFIALDKRSGAIVASITTQPPYGEDWPRDGAFINYALDLAGLHDLVRKRNLDFYALALRIYIALDPYHAIFINRFRCVDQKVHKDLLHKVHIQKDEGHFAR